MSNEIQIIQDIQAIQITPDTIRKNLCPKATDQELALFIELCRHQNLNPFIKEAYLIKYGDSPATMVVGKDVFLKRANSIPTYRGFDAGIIYTDKNGETQRTAGLFPAGCTLIGGWASVSVENRIPVQIEVNLSEYSTGQSNWKSKPATMIRKVALVQSLRESFPDQFQGMFDEAEMGQSTGQKYDSAIADISQNDIEDNEEKLAAYVDTVASITNKTLLTHCMDEAKTDLSDSDYTALRSVAILQNKIIKNGEIIVEANV